MKIRFIVAGQGIMENIDTLISEFEVAKKPTKKQIEAIYADINKVTEKYHDREIDITNELYERVCRNACKKHLTIVKNPTVHTFYIY